VVLSPPLPLPPPQLAEVWSVQNSEEIHRQSIDKPLVIKVINIVVIFWDFIIEQGSWKSRATRSIHLLKTSTLRMMQVFSEIKAEYKLPVTVKSTTISCTFTCGAQIISLATEPACLVIWEFGTHQVISIDIDEYLPGAQRMQAGSVLFNGKPCVAIVAQDSIYVFNLADNSVFSLAVPSDLLSY
jgi:hypothetical protein